ncbi:hypothetical protein [Nocardia harenae]|uniref:hypothetical protein n=1 Tax=Nocardia harenae TaxID=358707 RepID=UPI0008356189|nr:hypothetical protein [Nocardia harenae]
MSAAAVAGYDGVDVLADHSILLAIPAFLPAFALVGVVVFIAVRDRRAGDDESESTEENEK